jgi:hypothetical protein
MVQYCNKCNCKSNTKSTDEKDCKSNVNIINVLPSQENNSESNYPKISSDKLPSHIKVRELFNVFDEALYRAFCKYKPSYGEMFLALFQLQQKLHTLYMQDIIKDYLELTKIDIVKMLTTLDEENCKRQDMYG